MITTLRCSRRYRGLLFLGICLLILAAIPARPANASLISQAVDNSLAEFTRGTFQRTSLGTIRAPSSIGKVVDQTGAVQLLPIGVLKQWFNSPFLLQEKVTDAATVALGNRIFVIGGTVSVNNVLANRSEEHTSELQSLRHLVCR